MKTTGMLILERHQPKVMADLGEEADIMLGAVEVLGEAADTQEAPEIITPAQLEEEVHLILAKTNTLREVSIPEMDW